MIAIIDYGMGNLRSVYNALVYLGADAKVTSSPHDLDQASHLILPGVGAFGTAMQNLAQLGLVESLKRQVVEKGKPFLGICLGMQLLATISQEHGTHQGLGWLDAKVTRLEPDDPKLKVPHMGWNDITFLHSHRLFARHKPNQLTFYFVHSYCVSCSDPAFVLAQCHYGQPFTAVVFKDNIVGTQFHPEKSQDNGLLLLETFIEWNP